jgi:pimeloyl-ACP methyl ester carboxylesterase
VIAWEESGGGRPLVLVHGLTEDRRSWDSVVPLLEDGFRCIRLDLRGHGESHDAADYSALAMAEDVATVVSQAGIDDAPVLIGHSLGAVVVTAYATGARAAGIVNVDQPLALAAFKAALEPLEPLLRGRRFREAIDAVFQGLGVDALPPGARAWADACHQAARQEVVLGVWGLVLETDAADLDALVESVLRNITVPYLAIHGDDPGPGYAEWLTGLVPSAVVEVWDGDGHYPHLVEPERFARRVRDAFGR